ncbi:MAG: hypothetical protein Fur0012_05770 [Elusimicrobiota bacterium]
MQINSLLADLAAITSYAPWDLREEDLHSLEDSLQKAEKLDKVSPSFSIKAVRMVFELKSLYSDLLREKPEEDPSMAFLFKSLNSAICALKERRIAEAISLASAGNKELAASRMQVTARGQSFIRKIKYDNIYLQLSNLLKTAGEMAQLIWEEKL